jgi:hypothetical protein
MSGILIFLKECSFAVYHQLAGILGVFFFFGLLLFLLSRLARWAFVNIGGRNIDVYFTGWLGTPVHELGHAFFCIIFAHKITAISLLEPSDKDGALGYVYHSWNKKSIYQNIGNFFIGAGPVIFGSIILFGAMYFLLPNSQQTVHTILGYDASKLSTSHIHESVSDVLLYAFSLLRSIFTPANFATYQFWIFVYIALCISSHMGLSLPDIKGMWMGFIFVLLISFILNAAAMVLKIDLNNYTQAINHKTAILTGILIFATLLSCINCGMTILLLAFVRLFKRRPAHA